MCEEKKIPVSGEVNEHHCHVWDFTGPGGGASLFPPHLKLCKRSPLRDLFPPPPPKKPNKNLQGGLISYPEGPRASDSGLEVPLGPT